MHWFKAAAPALLLTIAAAPAQAADWWLMPVRPGTPTALFADLDTLERDQGGVVKLQVLRIDRAGRSSGHVERIRCDDAGGGADAPLHRFACASGAERERYGLILAGMPPDEAARMVFAIPARPRS